MQVSNRVSYTKLPNVVGLNACIVRVFRVFPFMQVYSSYVLDLSSKRANVIFGACSEVFKVRSSVSTKSCYWRFLLNCFLGINNFFKIRLCHLPRLDTKFEKMFLKIEVWLADLQITTSVWHTNLHTWILRVIA